MKLIHIPQGNIPSLWAHSFQSMKMAEAWNRHVDDFTLLTRAHWKVLEGPRWDFESWYGIRDPFRIVQLGSHDAPPDGLFTKVWPKGFDKDSVDYALDHGADLVFTRLPKAALRCVEHGLPAILEEHSDRNEQFEDLRRAAQSPLLEAVVTISDVLRRGFAKAGVPEEKILVWPDAVDLESFDVARDRTALRRDLGLPVDRWIAVYCGHLYPDRGVEQILEAAAETPDVFFLLVGGWDRDVAERRRQSRHLANVSLTGFVENRKVPFYLASADAVLVPYSARCRTARWMSPLKLFEAMASRRPIVATDLPAIRRHLEDGRNALLVDCDQAPALASAIRRLRDRPALAAALAAAAYEDVKGWTWDRRVRAILRFVRQRPTSP